MTTRTPTTAPFCVTCNRRDVATDRGRCIICGNFPSARVEAAAHDVSVYDPSHPLLVQLARRRALASRCHDHLLAPSDDVPARSSAPRDTRISVTRAAVSLVLVAQARWSAAVRAQCDHVHTFPQHDRRGREFAWCSSCGSMLPSLTVSA